MGIDIDIGTYERSGVIDWTRGWNFGWMFLNDCESGQDPDPGISFRLPWSS